MPLPLLLLVAALIQVRGQPMAGGQVSGSADVPLERARDGDTPVLSLNSAAGPVRLLLDTGASSSMVTPALLARLGLASSALAPSEFAMAGGGEGCQGLRPRRTRLPPLRLGARGREPGLVVEGLEALVLPAGALPQGIDGVLGAPTLRRTPVWIDPLADRVAFGAAALRAGGDGGGGLPLQRRRLPLRWHQGVPLITLQTPLGPVPALADTGAEGLFLSTGLAARLRALDAPRPLQLVGFCGEQPVHMHRYGALALTPAASPAGEGVVEAIVTANPIFAALGVEAIVGQELLRQRRQLWRLDQEPPRLELR